MIAESSTIFEHFVVQGQVVPGGQEHNDFEVRGQDKDNKGLI